MYAGISRSETPGPGEDAAPVQPIPHTPTRTAGVRGRFDERRGQTVPATIFEHGGYRLARPSTFAPHLEATLVNTGGGVVGGDRVGIAFTAASGTDVVISTQAAERIYRTASAPAVIEVSLALESGARMDWLPQQTIVYAGSKLQRRIDVAVATDSRLLMVEILTFGRPASRETSLPIAFVDNWRVRRDGRLVFAEAQRLEGGMADLLARPAIGGGARTSALVLYVAPNAESCTDLARRALADTSCAHGVSTWNGILAARLLAAQPGQAITAITNLARALSERPVPRAWSV